MNCTYAEKIVRLLPFVFLPCILSVALGQGDNSMSSRDAVVIFLNGATKSSLQKRAIGAGTLVSGQGHILTAYSIVARLTDKSVHLHENIRVRFKEDQQDRLARWV